MEDKIATIINTMLGEISTPKDMAEAICSLLGVSSRFMLFQMPEFYPSGGVSDCVGRYETLEAAKEAIKNNGYYENCYIYDRWEDKVVFDPEENES